MAPLRVPKPSASFSPLEWGCPRCHRRHSKLAGELTILRGTCYHDVCSRCIERARADASESTDDGSLRAFACPISGCTSGKFYLDRYAANCARGDHEATNKVCDNGKSDNANDILGVKIKQERNNRDVIDLCDEDDDNFGEEVKSVRITRRAAASLIKKEKEGTPKLKRCKAKSANPITPLSQPSISTDNHRDTVKEEVKEEVNSKQKAPGGNVQVKKEDQKSTKPPSAAAKLEGRNTMSPPPPTDRRNLKPLFDIGDEVYAAWWDPKDKAIKNKRGAQWYYGKIRAFDEKGHGEYGPFRIYDIIFDDGDRLDALNDYWVVPKRDHQLETRGREVIGVTRKFDKTSSDKWAKEVGWFEVVIDGKPLTYSLLSDAMKAHDSNVVRSNGYQTKESQLNMPEDYQWLFEEQAREKVTNIKYELKQETESDDDSRFSEVDEEEIAKAPNSKRMRVDTLNKDFWAIVANPIDFSREAFMTKPLYHLNPGIGDGHNNKWFGPFIREGIGTPGFSRVPREIARNVPSWSYEKIRDAINKDSYDGEEIRSASQVALWLKHATVGSFVLMRHEFPKCPLMPSRLKNNGEYIGPVYVIGVITKKVLPGSAEERKIKDEWMGEFDGSYYNTHTFCLVDWRWMGTKSELDDATRCYMNVVCQPTLARICDDPKKIYKSGASAESIRRNLWEKAVIPINKRDFSDVFDIN
ncbi:hypothetical protein ACHAWF_012441 [Thalassiosira exigua]